MKRNRFSVIVLSFIFAISFAGCNLLMPSEEHKLELYLEEKYGEDFTFINEIEYNGYGSQEAYIYSSASHPDAEILARYDTSTGKCKDNYMDIMYEKQAGEYVKKTLESVYGNAPVAVCMHIYRESDIREVYSFEDYMKVQTPNLLAVMYYDIPKEKAAEYIDLSDEAVNNSELPFNLALFVETDKPDLSGFDRSYILAYSNGNSYDHLILLGNSLFDFSVY